MAQVQHENGRFSLKEEDKTVGEMTYTRQGDVITINHTEVDRELEGQGLGKNLVDAAVDFARENNLKINPTCRYADHILKKDDSYKDVLA